MSKIFSLPKESVNVEYKSRFNPFVIGEVICAFLNTIGGKIYIGIDNDSIVGIDEKTATDIIGDDRGINGKFHEVLTNINPFPINCVTIEKNHIGDKLVLIINVKERNNTIYSFRNVVYIRTGIINHKSSHDIIDVLKSNKRSAKKLPILEEYTPSDKTKTKSASFDDEKNKNNVHYKKIGILPNPSLPYYKYCSLDIVLEIFRKNIGLQTIRFVEPPYWDDQFESRFYSANYKKVNMDPNYTPKLYATCFTPRKESEPAWKIYNRDKEGLGKRCVQFKFNRIKLRQELVKNLKNCTIVEGVVDYKKRAEIEHIHLSDDSNGKPNESYKTYFSNFTLDNYISLLLLKRTAFEHEQEVRIFIIYDNDKLSKKASNKDKAGHKDVSFDWLNALEGVKVDKECEQIEIDLLQDLIYKLVDNSGKNDDEKDELKANLKVEKYDINRDEDRNIRLKIGETYAAYQKRKEAKATDKKTATKKSVAKKTATKKGTAKKP